MIKTYTSVFLIFAMINILRFRRPLKTTRQHVENIGAMQCKTARNALHFMFQTLKCIFQGLGCTFQGLKYTSQALKRKIQCREMGNAMRCKRKFNGFRNKESHIRCPLHPKNREYKGLYGYRKDNIL